MISLRNFAFGASTPWKRRTAELKQKEAQMAVLESKVEELKSKQASFETLAVRLEALELRQNQPIRITAEKSIK